VISIASCAKPGRQGHPGGAAKDARGLCRTVACGVGVLRLQSSRQASVCSGAGRCTATSRQRRSSRRGPYARSGQRLSANSLWARSEPAMGCIVGGIKCLDCSRPCACERCWARPGSGREGTCLVCVQRSRQWGGGVRCALSAGQYFGWCQTGWRHSGRGRGCRRACSAAGMPGFQAGATLWDSCVSRLCTFTVSSMRDMQAQTVRGSRA